MGFPGWGIGIRITSIGFRQGVLAETLSAKISKTNCLRRIIEILVQIPMIVLKQLVLLIFPTMSHLELLD